MWEEERAFEVDAPTTEEYPLDSMTADELREKYVANNIPEAGLGRIARGGIFGAPSDGHNSALLGLVLDADLHNERIADMRWTGSPSSLAPLRTVCALYTDWVPRFLLTGLAAYMNGRLHAGHAFSFSKSMTTSNLRNPLLRRLSDIHD